MSDRMMQNAAQQVIGELQERIAELEAEIGVVNNRLIGALHLLPADVSCGELRHGAETVQYLRERAEEAEAALKEALDVCRGWLELDTVYDLTEPDGSPDPAIERLIRESKALLPEHEGMEEE